MIISHKHKFIFFAMPKTGTHSLREALRRHMGPEDWEQQMLFGKNVLPIPQLAALGHGHISARQLKPRLTDEIWKEYFKFSFVRDPYDRFVSTYFFLTRNQRAPGEDDTRQMKETFRLDAYRRMILVAPQYRLITGPDGTVAMDYVARYEDIQAGFDHICGRIGIPSRELARKNSSDHDAFNTYYDEELRSMVADFYRNDFDLFGYDINR